MIGSQVVTQRNIQQIGPEMLWLEWRDDIQRIKRDIHELFSSRRTFREIADVFRQNERLQSVGADLWDWMRVCYASYVVMRVRRETDDQGNTINLSQLLREIEARPEVITRRRFFEMLDLDQDSYLVAINEKYFTEEWTSADTRTDPDDPGSDHVHTARVAADRRALRDAVDRVVEVANRQVAHRTRVDVQVLSIPEVDEAFDAIERVLKRYYVLLRGATILRAEPTPQFDTHAVFTFPWIDPETRS